MNTKLKTIKRERKHRMIRSTVIGTEARPRLAVFRSNKFIYAQLIDDSKAVTIAAASDIKSDAKTNKVERAKLVGAEIANKAKSSKIEAVVFDRGGFSYAGRIKALADAAREAGLKF